MSPVDFVYKSVIDGCKAKSVPLQIVKEQADIAVDAYKKSAMGGKKVAQFIEEQIKRAKARSKGVK